MAYNGSIELISGITQKNNGTFPLVDSGDIRVTDEVRLDEKISDIDSSIDTLEPPATSSDVGKFLKVKTVADGKVSEYEFGSGGGGGGSGADLPSGGSVGDLLAKTSNADGAVGWITPANSPEQDNTRPITAAAVYTEIGNINALLAAI